MLEEGDSDDISLNRGWSRDGGSRGHSDLFFEVLEKLKYKELKEQVEEYLQMWEDIKI